MRAFRRLIPVLLLSVLAALVCQRNTTPAPAAPAVPIQSEAIDWEDSLPTLVFVAAEPVPTDTPPEPLYIEAIPLTAEHQTLMQEACEVYEINYALALAVMEHESSFNLDADSGICWGPMQINPINYEWLRECGIEPTTHEGNIVAGVLMLGDLLDKYDDTHKALMAYNCGETGAARLWREGYTTSSYSRAVVESAEEWQQIINSHLGGN